MATPHNEANVGEIAKTVLMPGDPLRAKYIAEKYLKNPVQFNTVRNMLGYTGTYKGKQISVMGSGMGIPSIGIYSYELYKNYGVESILRIGSAGAFIEDLKLNDIVLADSAWSMSTYAKAQSGDESDVQFPSEELNQKIEETSKRIGIPVVKGRVNSGDAFYREVGVPNYINFRDEHGCICGEMESFGLFHNAKVLEKHAACLLTISDVVMTREAMSTEEREKSFDRMMTLALETFL